MRSLYPAIEPFYTHSLAVDQRHSLYIEECGNPEGIPVLFLHGGPGAGCTPTHRQFFDPRRYRIILFDQRGCGRSTPDADLIDNTTHHLVADIDSVRRHLNIDRWIVFGGSWGSTLALAYAEQNSSTVLGMILRGIFLCRDEDIQWFYQRGTDRLFPDYWQDYLKPIAQDKRDDMVRAYHELLTGPDQARKLEAALAWSLWEARTATLLPDPATQNFFAQKSVALSMARIECHYFMNQTFLRPNQLLENAEALANIPGVIVHGRYDAICPVDQAFALSKAWPGADLFIVPDAGHAATEPGIIHTLITATDQFAKQIGESCQDNPQDM